MTGKIVGVNDAHDLANKERTNNRLYTLLISSTKCISSCCQSQKHKSRVDSIELVTASCCTQIGTSTSITVLKYKKIHLPFPILFWWIFTHTTKTLLLYIHFDEVAAFRGRARMETNGLPGRTT